VEAGIALPHLGDISFSHFRIRSGNPIVVCGSPETIIENVSFNDVRIETSGEDAIRCRHCRNISFSDVELSHG